MLRAKNALLLLVLLIPVASLGADTPDGVVGDLAASWEQRNYPLYEGLLNEQFLFFVAPEDVETRDRLDRAFDLELVFRLFTGEPIVGPSGEILAPIQNIDVALTPEGDWTSQVPVEFEGTLLRRYGASVRVTFVDQSVLDVSGLQEFYVEEISSGNYGLRFWRDLGVGFAASEAVSWSRLKLGGFTPVATTAETLSEVKSRY